MEGWRSRMRFDVVVPGKDRFSVWAENRFYAVDMAVEELNKRFGSEGWGRAYLTDVDGRVLHIIYSHYPTKEEMAVANTVYLLDMAVPFFEWLFGLIELMGDAPYWEASYNYPSHSVEVSMNRAEDVLKVTVWEQGEKREAETTLS